MSQVKIREAMLEDFYPVYLMMNELEGKVYDQPKQHHIFQYNLHQDNIIYLVALKNDKVIGFLSCHIQYLLHHNGKVAEIQEMFVLSEFRSDGVGELLFEKLKKRVQGQEIVQFEVTSNVKRNRAHEFYLRMGFEWTHKKFVLPCQ